MNKFYIYQNVKKYIFSSSVYMFKANSQKKCDCYCYSFPIQAHRGMHKNILQEGLIILNVFEQLDFFK